MEETLSKVFMLIIMGLIFGFCIHIKITTDSIEKLLKTDINTLIETECNK